MIKRAVGGLAVALLALTLCTPALAGGWAVVTLDSLPDNLRAGQSYQIGFMVRQHGVTPINSNPFEGGPLRPLLLAHNTTSGDTIEREAVQQGATGHFVVDVTFPSAGEWEWEITPPPFEGTRFAPLAVLAPAAAGQPAASAQPVALAQPALIIAGLALLVLAGLLAALRVPAGLRRGGEPL
jgi:hypothetical protein